MTEGSGAVAGLLTGIQVGAALFASQLVVGDVGVGLLGVLRYSIALLFLFPLLLLKPSTPVARSDWLPIILLGLGQIGVMIALLNTAVFYTSAARVALKRYGTIKISTVAFTASMVPLGFIAIILPSAVTPDQWSGLIWWLVLAIGLSSGIGYLLWFHAIERLPATLVTGFLALSPITAAVLSLIFLKAAVTPSLLIAVALVSGGIACFARFQSRPTDRKVRPL